MNMEAYELEEVLDDDTVDIKRVLFTFHQNKD